MRNIDNLSTMKNWARARQLVRPWRGRVALLVAASLTSGLFEAVFLVVVTRTALAIADDQDTAGLFAGWEFSVEVALVIAALLLAARLVLALAGVLASTAIEMNLSIALRRDFTDAYLRSSWATQQGEPAGRLQQLLTSFVAEALAVVSSLTLSITSALNLVALLVIAVLVDPVASLVVIVALFVLGTVLTPVRHRIRASSKRSAQSQQQLASTVAELGGLGLEMQSFGVRDRFADTIGQLVDREARVRRSVNSLTGSLGWLYSSLALGAVLLGLSVASVVGVAELSSIGAVMLVMLRSLSFGQQLQIATGGLVRALPFLEELDETLVRYRASAATEGHVQMSSVDAIEGRNVDFSYSSGRHALVDLSFRLETGEIVGVIGPSGAGKSTLVQLLLGVRKPDSGSIIVGGVDLATIERRSWTDLVSFVPQEPNLITGTVAENIVFFRSGIDESAVRAAALAANVLTDIEALPQGFDTHIGERGSQLSGGQRQRIAIARALAKSPRFLVLDEPTSSLDMSSESLIRDTIGSLRGRVTVVIIAHRMSTLDMCDRLMVIEAGRIMAFDTPERLRHDSAFYREALMLSGIE